jgi:hypothetical protein
VTETLLLLILTQADNLAVPLCFEASNCACPTPANLLGKTVEGRCVVPLPHLFLELDALVDLQHAVFRQS